MALAGLQSAIQERMPVGSRAAASKKITASSIDLGQMQSLKVRGFLAEIPIKALNAESIALPDGSVDFVCCKEAYHHFPRAPIGFYEMLRVSRVGIALVAEPNGVPQTRLLDRGRRLLKRVLRRNTAFANPDFEGSGNFIFGPTLFETKKMATGLQLAAIYYSHLSDFYSASLSGHKLSDRTPALIVRAAIALQNTLSRLGLMSWARINLLVFKEMPDKNLDEKLVAAGFNRLLIPRNPYLGN